MTEHKTPIEIANDIVDEYSRSVEYDRPPLRRAIAIAIEESIRTERKRYEELEKEISDINLKFDQLIISKGVLSDRLNGYVQRVYKEYSTLKAVADRMKDALNDIAQGNIEKMPPLDDVLEFRTQMWSYSQRRAKQALTEYKEVVKQ